MFQDYGIKEIIKVISFSLFIFLNVLKYKYIKKG